jgi:hypothetical protein
MAMLNNQIKRNNNMTNHPLIWNKPSSDKDDKGGAPFYGLCFLHYAHSVRKNTLLHLECLVLLGSKAPSATETSWSKRTFLSKHGNTLASEAQ